MPEKFVGKRSEFKDGDRRIVFVGDKEIGVFRDGGQFYAYSNFCLHQGGPACEGLTIAKVEERLRPDKTSRGLYFSETEMHFVCPWHGYEYDMKPANASPTAGSNCGNMKSCRKGMRSMSSPKARRRQRWLVTRGRTRPADAGEIDGDQGTSERADALSRRKVERELAEGSLRRPDDRGAAGVMAAACKLYAAQVEAGDSRSACRRSAAASPPPTS